MLAAKVPQTCVINKLSLMGKEVRTGYIYNVNVKEYDKFSYKAKTQSLWRAKRGKG